MTEKRSRSELEQIKREARASGRPNVWAEPRTDASPLDLITDRGQLLQLWPGSVEMVNPAGCAYDYRIEISIVKNRAVLDEISVRRRSSGPNLSRRRISTEPLGWLMDQAIAFLTTPPDSPWSEVPISPRSANSLRVGRRPPGGGTDRKEELELVVAAHRDGQARGVGVRGAIRDALRQRGYSHSEGQVKKLLRMARDEGLLPESRPGRPSRVHRA